MRSHLERVVENTKTVPQVLLDAPPLPDNVEHWWNWWVELHEGRTPVLGGKAGITWEAIDSWCRLTQRRLSPYDVNAIRAIDRAYLTADSLPELGIE